MDNKTFMQSSGINIFNRRLSAINNNVDFIVNSFESNLSSTVEDELNLCEIMLFMSSILNMPAEYSRRYHEYHIKSREYCHENCECETI